MFFHCIIPEAENDRPFLYSEETEGEGIHLGGLFNSLYPQDVEVITGAKNFAFSFVHRGRVGVEILLHNPGRATVVLCERWFPGNEETEEQDCLEVPDFTIQSGCRLTVRLKGTPGVSKMGWMVRDLDSEGTPQPKLAIVICTYRNQDLVTENVSKLISSDVWNEEDLELIVVDNGSEESGLSFDFSRVHHIVQENLGGSGGFLRGIREAFFGILSGRDFTHVLLMDDDVAFHPEMIHRAFQFQKYATNQVVIGASMLRLEAPDFLHEAGGRFKSAKSLGSYSDVPRGRVSRATLAALGRGRTHDYNAWWFCSFSKVSVVKAGLPLPMFIHGDDLEYGVRLGHHGVKTYCPGGLSIWHKSFESKLRTWIRYFDFRNALIRLVSQQGKMANNPRIAPVQLRRVVRKHIIRNDYGAAALANLAYKDFLRGPSILDETNYGKLIEQLDAVYKKHTRGEERGGIRQTSWAEYPKWLKKPMEGLRYLTSNLHHLPIETMREVRTENTRYSWGHVPPFTDVVMELPNGEIASFRRDRAEASRLLKEVDRLIRSTTPSALEAWKDIKEYTAI